MKVRQGLRVRVRVELTVVDGQPLEKSIVEYIQGAGSMLPGLERIVEGLEKGDFRSGVLKAEDAFGNSTMHPLKKMPRSEFPAGANLVFGERFAAKGSDGADVLLSVENVSDDVVEVRLVHPLHDKDLRYSIEILGVRDPSPPPVPGKVFQEES